MFNLRKKATVTICERLGSSHEGHTKDGGVFCISFFLRSANSAPSDAQAFQVYFQPLLAVLATTWPLSFLCIFSAGFKEASAQVPLRLPVPPAPWNLQLQH
jgi:hypothetical protein